MKSKSRNNAVSYFDMQFITSSISTTLVLLLLGLVVFFVLAANNLSVYVRENINFSVLISDDMKETDILKLQKRLNNEPFVKETEYISKKQALKEQTEAMGTDPQEFLGYNPFTASIEIKLHSDYANSDSIAKIEKLIKRNTNIQDVLYQKDLIDAVNENIRNISLVLLALAVMLTFISFALINNTIRLAIYSNRRIIGLRMHARCIQRIAAVLNPHKPGTLLESLRPQFRHFQKFPAAGKPTVFLPVRHDIFGDCTTDTRNVG